MNNKNLDKTQEDIDRKYRKKDVKRKKKMKVSGAGVKKLQRIIGGSK